MLKNFAAPRIFVVVALAAFARLASAADEPDVILHHGKIVTVDRAFSVHEAMSVKDGRILAVGASADLLKRRGERTKVFDLGGKMVLPGLGDSHVHPADAAMTEFDHPVPDMESIADVLNYIASRAKALAEGEWVVVRQVFITRLREQRYPTKDELDAAAPRHPVVFSTGPDASANSLALAKSGIDKNFQVTGPGKVEKDTATGEPTGILRSAMRYLKVSSPEKKPTPQEQDERLVALLRDYASVGLTSIIDRNASAAGVNQYRRLHAAKKLPLRIRISQHVDNSGKTSDMVAAIERVAADPLCRGDDMLRIIGIKTFLDGGMLTGSAYLLRPWGVSRIYSIDDPGYRGLLYLQHETLVPMVRAAVTSGLQFTAHSVGDGAVQALIDAYEEVNKTLPVAPTRPCVTHSNFMTRKSIEQAARLGVMLDIQPAWLYLDTRTLVAQFGEERLRYFQPLKTLFEAGVTAGGGSDHMQKIGSLRSINPYDPWLGIWVTLTRRARWHDKPLHPEESLSREQAIRFYTINNAKIMFLDDRTGSLEAGKLADFVVIDRDLLTCPIDDIRETKVVSTWLEGRPIYGDLVP
jgi:predicted amidohydrolase YtcJ